MTADLMPQQVVFVVDDTGSMSDEIASVKATINGKIDQFSSASGAEHYTVITFKDDVTERGQTADAETVKGWVSGLYASGGGDCPEASYEALQRAADIAPTSDAWLMTDASPCIAPGEIGISPQLSKILERGDEDDNQETTTVFSGTEDGHLAAAPAGACGSIRSV